MHFFAIHILILFLFVVSLFVLHFWLTISEDIFSMAFKCILLSFEQKENIYFYKKYTLFTGHLA